MLDHIHYYEYTYTGRFKASDLLHYFYLIQNDKMCIMHN